MPSKPLCPPSVEAAALAKRLASCEFFGEFRPQSRRTIVEFSRLRRLERGETLFEASAPCSALHLLLEGDVKMHKIAPDGKEQVIRRLKPGQIFGAAPLFTPQGVYPATAVALEPSRVLVVPKAEFVRFLKGEPELFLKVLAFVSSHLQDMMRLAERVSLDSVPRRVASRILEQARREGGPRAGQSLVLGTSQAELAAELGSVREVVGRALQSFQKKGWIRRERGRLVLADPASLESFGG
jgi:CRP/FNR family transcriptional regulator